jgi:hypothetical protein
MHAASEHVCPLLHWMHLWAPLTAGQQALTPCGVPDGGDSGLSTSRQMPLRQQSPGSRLGKKAQLTLGAAQGVGAVVHWPPWQVWPSGQHWGAGCWAGGTAEMSCSRCRQPALWCLLGSRQASLYREWSGVARGSTCDVSRLMMCL